MDEKYKFLFPFEHIPRESKIFIYGAGIMGQEYFRQIRITGYCEVLGFIDREWEKYCGSVPPVYSIQQAMKNEFDYIVIAVKVATRAGVIRDDLVAQGVSADKVLYVSPRTENEFILKNNILVDISSLAYNIKPLSLAIRLGNGLGSAIIKKKIFEEMVKRIPGIYVDIYSMMDASSIDAIYGFEENYNRTIHEAGDVYERNKRKYTLSMRISTSIMIDYVDYDKLNNVSSDVASFVKRLEEYGTTDAGSDFKYPSNIHVMRNIFKGKNCYSAYDCDGLFDIQDMRVKIVLNEAWKDKFYGLKIKRYITINYGNGQTMEKEDLISKQWPYEYFCDFVEKFKAKWGDITVIQIGAAGARIVEGVDGHLFGENIELIKYVLDNSLLHVDIEGGLVHLASQLGTRCAVLFGPTPIEFFGYKENINIKMGACSGCIGLYQDGYYCARGLKQAECMLKIKPDDLIDKISEDVFNFGRNLQRTQSKNEFVM